MELGKVTTDVAARASCDLVQAGSKSLSAPRAELGHSSPTLITLCLSALGMKCAHCHEEIQYGKDVISVEEGVVGPRGFISLEEKLFFCSEECLRDYFDKVDLSKLPKVKRKIP